MAQTSQNRKQLAEQLRSQGDELEKLFSQLNEQKIPSYLSAIVKWFAILLARVGKILPSEAQIVKSLEWLMGWVVMVVDKLDIILSFLKAAIKAASMLVITNSTNSHKPSSKDIGPNETKKRQRQSGKRRKSWRAKRSQGQVAETLR
jgi:hypothetical protein